MFKKFLFIFILLPFYSFSQNKINYKVFYDKNLEENGLKFLDLVAKYLNQDISYFFQKHIISGEHIELVSEKWIDCFMFKTINNIPRLELKENSEVKYPLN